MKYGAFWIIGDWSDNFFEQKTTSEILNTSKITLNFDRFVK